MHFVNFKNFVAKDNLTKIVKWGYGLQEYPFSVKGSSPFTGALPMWYSVSVIDHDHRVHVEVKSKRSPAGFNIFALINRFFSGQAGKTNYQKEVDSAWKHNTAVAFRMHKPFGRRRRVEIFIPVSHGKIATIHIEGVFGSLSRRFLSKWSDVLNKA